MVCLGIKFGKTIMSFMTILGMICTFGRSSYFRCGLFHLYWKALWNCSSLNGVYRLARSFKHLDYELPWVPKLPPIFSKLDQYSPQLEFQAMAFYSHLFQTFKWHLYHRSYSSTPNYEPFHVVVSICEIHRDWHKVVGDSVEWQALEIVKCNNYSSCICLASHTIIPFIMPKHGILDSKYVYKNYYKSKLFKCFKVINQFFFTNGHVHFD